MPKLIFARHADAGEPDPKRWPDDSTRPLTKRGVKHFKKVAKGIRSLIKPDRVLTSPAARCMQTASLLEWDADWPAATATDVLNDGHASIQVADYIKSLDEWPCTVALVGHGPNLVELLNWLTSRTDSRDLDKGGMALVRVNKKIKPGSGELSWQMTQKELKQRRDSS